MEHGMFDGPVLSPPLWVELAAVVAGALAGTAVATRRGLDIVGVLTLGVVSGLGGGIIRDLLLNTLPLALRNPAYLWTVIGAAGVGLFFGSIVRRVTWVLVGVEALALGFFTLIGVERALLFGLPSISAVFVGTVTGVGGSVIRDVLTGSVPPVVLRREAPFATLSMAGGIVYLVGTDGLELPAVAVGLFVVAGVAAVRLFSLRLGWVTPGPIDLTPRRLRGQPRE
jgi:uncharacterized membrane protein YeiH